MRIILLTTAAAILSGCVSQTPPLCVREDDPALKFGTVDGCGFVRPDAGGDGFNLPARPVKPTEPQPPFPVDPDDDKDPPTDPKPPVDPVDPEPPTDPDPEEPTDPEPETPVDPGKPADPEKPQDPPKDPKPPKDKDNAGHGNGDEGDCKGKGCSDADNPGKGKK